MKLLCSFFPTVNKPNAKTSPFASHWWCGFKIYLPEKYSSDDYIEGHEIKICFGSCILILELPQSF